MRSRRRLLYTVELLVLLLLTLCAWSAPTAWADDTPAGPPTAPMLRVETGGHTAAIKSMSVDSAGRYLVTGSSDKTVRVWDARDGSAITVLRPPIGDKDEGTITAVGISPDGDTVVCGGVTGYAWDHRDCAYIFDRATGRLTHRIADLPGIVHSLAYSSNGSYVVLGLGHQGIRLYRTSDWTQIGDDTDYADAVYGVSFSTEDSPRLATCSLDGYARIYTIDDSQSDALNLQIKSKLDAGKEPVQISITPSGDKVAVGFQEKPVVAVLSTSDLSVVKTIDLSGNTPGQYFTLPVTFWSHDGDTLFAAGGCFQSGMTSIFAWPDGGTGDIRTISTSAKNSILTLVARPGGGVYYGSGDDFFGAFDSDDKKVFEVASPIANISGDRSLLQVNNTGKIVQYTYDPDEFCHYRFSIADRAISGPIYDSLTDPITKADGLDIDLHSDDDRPVPTLNGSTLTLDDSENGHAFAIAPDHGSFVIGAAWHVYCFNADGAVKWKNTLPGDAWQVNVSGDGRFAVASLEDGTIRWYRMTDGQELLAFFPSADKKRWVMWTPSGYYDCSPGGDDLVGWHINGASDQAAAFYPVSRFSHQFYRPDVIQKVLDAADEAEAVKEADEEAGRKKEQADIADRLPPVVTILSPDYGAEVDETSVTLRYTVHTPSDAPVTSVKYLVDGRPASDDRDLQLVDSSDAQSATITIPEHDCTISVIAENEYGAGEVASVRVTWNGASEVVAHKPTLYVLAVGVGAYSDPIPSLKYPAKDASDFVAAVTAQKGLLYKDVVVKKIENEQATRANILDGFDWIEKQPTQYDVAIIYLSGHGANDSLGSYYFAGVDINPDHLRETGVPFTDIKDTIQSLACKTIFFIDTCHSGNALGTASLKALDVNGVVNELSSAENGAVVFASSTGRQVSEESDEWHNGAFTKALVEGLDGKAANGSAGRITWMSLSRYISDRVKELTGGAQTPTTTTPSTVPDFPIAFVK